MRVLFVCTGNTCRSPLAEAIARRLDADNEYASAGRHAQVVDLNEEGIADPYGGDEQAYRATAVELEALIRGMM